MLIERIYTSNAQEEKQAASYLIITPTGETFGDKSIYRYNLSTPNPKQGLSGLLIISNVRSLLETPIPITHSEWNQGNSFAGLSKSEVNKALRNVIEFRDRTKN